PNSRPVPTVQPHRLNLSLKLKAASALLQLVAKANKPVLMSHVTALTCAVTSTLVLAHAPPPFTYHSVRSCGPEIRPSRASIVAMSLTLNCVRADALATVNSLSVLRQPTSGTKRLQKVKPSVRVALRSADPFRSPQAKSPSMPKTIGALGNCQFQPTVTP